MEQVKMTGKKYEILAPAGSLESLFAAVRSGADAVYFGMKDFSARRNAGNFSTEEMISGVKYCKRSGVKTYLALNIAVKEKEMLKALETAKEAYFAGVDGFIISDLGLAKVIRGSMPDVELHASTQMTVNSPAALPVLKNLGFSRVVPAREMSKTELARFCEEAGRLGIEVEVFVHGALCMCLSGQCLMSSVLGGRSGNRGLCAGPCRLPFEADAGTGYDLSLKDLSLLKYVDELTEMGVYSFKIEGRMKRPEYIAAAVTACKTALQKGFLDTDTEKALSDVFSRSGFTDGYYTGATGREMFGVRRDTDIEKSKSVYKLLHELYRNEYHRIPVEINCEIKKGKPLKMEFVSGKNRAFAVGKIPEKAVSKSLDEQSAAELASKLGGTPFFAEKINILLDEDLFLPASEINKARRICCENLGKCLEETPERRFFEPGFTESYVKDDTLPQIYAEFLSAEQIPESLEGVSLIILPACECEKAANKGLETAVRLPKFIADEQALADRLDFLKSKGVKKALCGTLPAVALAEKCGMQVIGDIGLNVLNHETVKVLESVGLSEITLSAEIDIKAATHLESPLKKGVFAYGRLPLMCVKNCPVKNGKTCFECRKNGKIKDRTGTEFPVTCKSSDIEILNSKPLYLADKLSSLRGLDYLLLSFTDEKKSDVRRVIDEYISGGEPKGEFTRGLYFKELL